jgi:small subunit ribosomal protein S17e
MISTINSKSLKNQIAGYITRFIKKEIRLKSEKEELIENQEKPEEDAEITTTDSISADAEPPIETVELEPTAK